MPLENLPVELNRHIFEGLAARDLASLALTCRKINLIATDILYQSITIIFHDDASYQELGRVPQLAHSILRSERGLGARVRNIRLHIPTSRKVYPPFAFPPGLIKSFEGAKDWSSLSPWGLEEHQQALRLKGGWYFTSALVLLRACSKARRISLRTDPTPLGGFWKLDLARFTHLQQLDWYFSHENKKEKRVVLQNQMLEGLAQLPALRKLRTSLVIPDDFLASESHLEMMPSLTSIKKLVLWDSAVRGRTLRRLLDLMPNLTSLKLGLLHDVENKVAVCDVKELGQALDGTIEESGFTRSRQRVKQLHKKLETLCLAVNYAKNVPLPERIYGQEYPEGFSEVHHVGSDQVVFHVLDGDINTVIDNMEIDENFIEGEDDSRHNLGSVKHFSGLKCLEVKPSLILGDLSTARPELQELLPNSLQRLCLRNDGYNWLEFGLGDMIEHNLWSLGDIIGVFQHYVQQPKKLPQLKTVCFKNWGIHQGDANLGKLKAVLEAVGIGLELTEEEDRRGS